MASKTKKDEIFSRGRELLARKDFQRALELFNMVSLSRHFSYCSLNDLTLLVLVKRSGLYTYCSRTPDGSRSSSRDFH